MAEGIRTVAVIGAGVMGTAIAAHLASAGLTVHLLDVVPTGAAGNERNALAKGAIEKALKASPSPFFDPDAAALVSAGNLEDHLPRLAQCDLVIEAIIENLAAKQALFAKIAPHLSAQAILASNTSGLSVAQMAESLPLPLRARFVVLHFFNPVRHMRLLEVVGAKEAAADVVERITRFGEALGKGVVAVKDTTNFVANRIGVYSMLFIMHEMLRLGLSVEAVDAIAGKPMGRPKSAAFNTADIVGIDTLLHVAKNCFDSLPDDPERSIFQAPEFVKQMVAQGALGRKSGAGFYKKVGKDILVLDIGTASYRPQQAVEFASLTAQRGARSAAERLKRLVNGNDVAAQFAWNVVAKTLSYSAQLLGNIADDVVSIDRAMRWGFNWELGPFEIWDALGVAETATRMKTDGMVVPAWVDAMLKGGRTSFYSGDASARDYFDTAKQSPRSVPRHKKHIELEALKAKGAVLEKNAGASLVDLGDGALCLELHSKMNTLDGEVIQMIDRAVAVAEQSFATLVVANDAEHFSAGANLMMIVGAAEAGKWDEVEGIIKNLQDALQRLRYASVPVVSAPCQYTLGGGAELAMASDASQAFVETYMGLVEVGVGLIPAGCGCLRMVERYTAAVADIEGVDLLPLVAQASLNIAMAKVSGSAEEAKRLRYLRPQDGISLNREFLLFEAKQRALGLAGAGYRPVQAKRLVACGADAAQTIGVRIWGMVEGGFASPHDALIARKVSHVLCGGNVAGGSVVSEQHFLDLERAAFLELCGEPKTRERIKHMLETGKPLRN